MTSKEAVLELICEAKSTNIDEGRVCFLRKTIEKDLEILKWLIANMHVVVGLLELRLTPPNNPTFEMKGLKYHNGIPIKNEDFNKYINRIWEIKEELENDK